MKYQNKDAYTQATEHCKILYRDLHRPCTETCMCWGWEFQDGWNEIVKDLSMRLEALNLTYYPKFGVRVVMDQLKEKYGTLHAYYHVEIEQPWYVSIWYKPFNALSNWIRDNFDFKKKWVVDRKGYYEDEVVEIPADKLEECRDRAKNISNVKIEERDSKWYEATTMYHPPVEHSEPTAHLFAYSLMNLTRTLSCKLCFHVEPTTKQMVIRDAVDLMASELIHDAEEKCYNVCECCGTTIGTKWSPRVMTKGWITYICEKCDIRKKLSYYIQTIKRDIENGTVLTEAQSETVKRVEGVLESDDYIPTEKLKSLLEEVSEIEQIGKNN